MSLTKHSNFLFAIILMISVATGVGWFYDGRITTLYFQHTSVTG